MKPVAYEGTEPYIFVSYAHRDSERVFEVLSELQDRDYRFWYDDGIAPGSEWPEDIAQHLDGAAMVMAFVTPNSMKSQNCRREINFSLSREKPFLSVLLEETEMPLGMQMQLSAQQSILRYNYDSWQAFISKILACPDIVPCRAEPEPEPEPEPAAPAVPTDEPAPAPMTPAMTPVQEVPETSLTKDVHASEEETPAPERLDSSAVGKAPRVTKAPAAKSEASAVGVEPGASSPKRKVSAVAILAAAVAIAAVALVFILAGQFKTSWGETFQKSGQVVNVVGQTLEQSDLERFAAMDSLRSLNLSECDLSGCDFSSVNFASSQLSEVWLESAKGINDYSFLEGMKLTRLYVRGCSNFDDTALDYVSAQNLKSLDVSGTAVTDLSTLAGDAEDGQDLPMKTLSFEDTKVKDISPLGQMQSLTTVEGTRSEVTSLEALAPLTELQELYFDGCAIKKITQTFRSLKLNTLSLAGSGVTDLSGLVDCTVFTKLDLSDNPKLKSMDWLDFQNYTTLKKLNLSQTGLASDNLAWIGKCAELTDLTLDGVPLADLSCVSGTGSLERISAINCGLEDISGLSQDSKLTTILLSCNKIESVAALSGLSLNDRVTLDLTNNAIKSVAELPVGEYRAIMLYGNDAGVADTLPEGIKAFEVSTEYFDEIRASSLGDVTNDLYVVGCPQNQVVKMQEAFGVGLNLVSEDELWELYTTDDFSYDLGDMSYFVSVVTGTEFAATGSEGGTTESSGMPSVTEYVPLELEVGSGS